MEQSAGRLRQSTIPLYRQILEGIKQKIEAGELKTGDKLPSEQELMEHYRVSRRTVRTAVDELCSQGCLVRKQGKGTFVSRPKLHRKIVNVLSFQEACEKCGMRPAHRLLACAVRMATPEEQRQLSLGGGARVLHTQRVLTADGEPVMVENAVYPYEAYAFLQKEDLNGPLYPLLRKKGLCLAYPGAAQHRFFAAQKAAGKGDAAEGDVFFCFHTGRQGGDFVLHGAHQADDIVHTVLLSFRGVKSNHTLNRNSMISPSFTTYSFPSVRCRPFAFTAAMLKSHAAKSS